MLELLPKDACPWSCWGHGWFGVPVAVGCDAQRVNAMRGVMAAELVRRFPEIGLAYGRLCHAGHDECAAYRLLRRRGNNDTLVSHDTRLPPTDQDVGVVLLPTRPRNSGGYDDWDRPPTAERVMRTLRYLTQFVRTSLLGRLYVPLLGVTAGGLDENDALELLTEFLSPCHDVVLTLGACDDVIVQSATSDVTPPITVSSVQIQQPQTTSPVTGESLIANEFETVTPKKTKSR